MFKNIITLVCFMCVSVALAQSNTTTSSPYSLFGLGTQSNAKIGKFNGLGKTGIAVKSPGFINIANPSSLGGFNSNLFLFDIGVLTEISTFSDDNVSDESKVNATLSNLAIAFPLIKKAGMGISITRASSVGYSLSGIESVIENTNELAISDVSGFGGINDLRFDFGYQVNDKLSLGLKISYLWGEIEEEETIVVGNNGITLEDVNLYSGFQLGLGFQFQPSKKILVGGVVDFGTSLKGTNSQFVSQIYEGIPSTISFTEETDISNFDYPVAMGFGLSYLPNEKLLITLDYKHFSWDVTDQEDSIGVFVDQTTIGTGAEYVPKANSLKYFDRVNYRAGLYYDSGYLEIDNSKIDNISGVLGIGLPIGKKGGMLNFSYTRGLRGSSDEVLVEENINQFNINLSLFDIWFKKRKYD